jgi:hypothetical protein
VVTKTGQFGRAPFFTEDNSAKVTAIRLLDPDRFGPAQ